MVMGERNPEATVYMLEQGSMDVRVYNKTRGAATDHLGNITPSSVDAVMEKLGDEDYVSWMYTYDQATSDGDACRPEKKRRKEAPR
eukprot:CAMPEP_0182522820 /NCGR_PEP_ID=MMETSP1323-20130603/586_1 /TAXON_ID=236787 /ORGANISM="Florenciella parvula, Strain RCC1693" /LENGTH=85 /DNA_ID=CAMNT_0024731039 /DNA_START=151 /DNA_END=408 /DNA_ORIENTATION=+